MSVEKWVLVAAVLGASGCSCGPSAPAQSPNGKYRQSAATLSDTCVPKACEGDGGIVPITSDSEASIHIPVSHCFGGQHEFGTSYVDAPSERTVYNSCGAPIGHEVLVLEQAGPPVVVKLSIDLDAGECASDAGFTFAAVWPQGPCRVEQRLTFSLSENCQPPCSLVLGYPNGGTDVGCRCP